MIKTKIFFYRIKQRISLFGISPTFDWRFIVILSFFFLVGGIVYSYILYKDINNGSIFNITGDESQKMEIVKKKESIEQNIRNNYK